MTDFIQIAPYRAAEVTLADGRATLSVSGYSGRNLVAELEAQRLKPIADTPFSSLIQFAALQPVGLGALVGTQIGAVNAPSTPPPNTTMRAVLQRRVAGVPGDLGWENAGSEVTLSPSATGYFVTWTGSLAVPTDETQASHRVLITESEVFVREDLIPGDPNFATSPADFLRERVVYADTFELVPERDTAIGAPPEEEGPDDSTILADAFPYSDDFAECVANVHAELPFGSDPAIAHPELVTMGFDDDEDATYHAGWELVAPTDSALCDLFAMFAGEISLDLATGALVLDVSNAVFGNAVRHQKPAWATPPQQIFYEGIDLDDFRRTQLEEGVSEEKIDSVLAGIDPSPVVAGQILVRIGGTQNEGFRHYIVRGLDNGNFQPADRNLAGFVEEYARLFASLPAHSLGNLLLQVRAPATIVRNGRRRFVEAGSASAVTAAAHGGPAADFFTDPHKPAKRLAEAVTTAGPHDVIVIRGRDVYAEGEIVIDRPMTIMAALAGKPQDDPTDTSFDVSRLPRLRPKATGRVLRLQGSPTNRLQGVQLFGVIVENGSTISSTPPVEIGGGGIGVVDCESEVRIERCLVWHNRTTATGAVGTVDFLAKLDAAIAGMPDGVPKLFLQAFRAAYAASDVPTTKPNFFLGGQGFGGGICFGWSNGHVYKCQVSANTGGGRGHGIGVVGYGWPVIDSSTLHDNAPNATGRRDGGGIGIEVSVPDGLTRSMTVGDLLDSFIAFLKSLTVADVVALLASVGYNIARGIGSFSNSEFLDLLPRVSIAFVRSIKSIAWNDARIEAALKSFVQIRQCRIERNVAGEGGGGVYGSVLSGVALSDNIIDNNRASAGAGGGVRLSLGSRGAMVGNLIRNNTQTSAVGLGGGGVALRNVGCVIADSDRASDIRNNAAGSGHGGGVCLDVIQEIDFNDDSAHPKHDQIYQAILRERFGFWRARLEIRNATVRQNSARAVLPAGTGGGVFVRRDRAFNVLNILVSIDDFAAVVSGNRATDARSHNFHLIDGNVPLDVRDASVSSLITNGKLQYSA